jgi:predicted nucleotide-binding protein
VTLFLHKVETHGGYRTGIVLAKRIRELYPSIPILAVSGSLDMNVKSWFLNQAKMSFLDKPVLPREVADEINILIQKSVKRKRKPKIFIVHGHDTSSKLELKNYLQNSLGLGEPIILHEQPNLGQTIIEKFEQTAINIDLVFVLLTPDDTGKSA